MSVAPTVASTSATLGDAAAPILELEGIGRSYGPVRALEDVGLCVRRGEFVALAGENGSGKSTLAKIASGLARPDAGTIRVEGAECRWSSPRDALGRGIALVSQEPTFVPELSVAENLLLTQLRSPLARTRRRAMHAQAAELLDAVGLDVDPRAVYRRLSEPQRELAEIARALAADPRLLILDEATSRITDPEGLFVLLERLRGERQLAVVIITHRLREIRRIADRAVVLRDGRLVGELHRGQLSDAQLSSMMVGRELADFFSKASVPLGGTALEVDGVVLRPSAAPCDLRVRGGEIVGLAGLDGSGRTELLETIGGSRDRVAGRVLVDGTAARPGVAGALAAGIALVPEDRMRQGIVAGLSVAANLTLGSTPAIARLRRRDEQRAGGELIRRFGIKAAGPGAAARTLSGGNQQKVVLARCMRRRPAVLLLDEPTRGVDIGAKHEIYQLLGELVADGTAVLMASSELPELLGVCDRIIVLHDGTVAGELDGADATEERVVLLSSGGAIDVDAA